MGGEVWTGFRQQADAQILRFDPKVVGTAMSTCNELISEFLTVRQQLEAVRNLNPFVTTPLQSGGILAKKFGRQAADLDQIIGDHITVVTDMAETFRAAAKAFLGAEEASAEQFNAIDSIRLVTNIPLTGPKFSPPAPQSTRVGEYKWKEPTNAVPLPKSDKEVFPLETPESMTWEELLEVGKSANHEPAAHAAAVWQWMSQELGHAVGAFSSQMEKPTGGLNDGWDGDSRVAAQNATRNYAIDVTNLANLTMNVSTSMANVASSIAKAKEASPTKARSDLDDKTKYIVPLAKGGQTTVKGIEAMLAIYQNNFKQTYIAGVIDFNSSIVTLPPAKTVTKPGTEQPGENKDPGGTRNPGENSPHTTTGTPSVPTPTSPSDEPQKPTEEKPKTNNPSDTTQDAIEQAVKQASTLVQSLVEQGSSLVQSAASQVQKGIEAVQQAATQAVEAQQQLVNSQLSPTTPTSPTTPLGTGGGGGGGGSPKVSAGPAPSLSRDTKSQLFPRAGVPVESASTTTAARAGVPASTTSTPSAMPMGAGAGAGAGQQGGGKEHKRADYLRSKDGLDEGLGDLPVAVTPVAEK